ncbi:MAG: Gmad2 immunoglobulin-like domain-containing protein [bacterium]|nr:Gmad2 immunoglobulin-like domain-containing protein [bacterium]
MTKTGKIVSIIIVLVVLVVVIFVLQKKTVTPIEAPTPVPVVENKILGKSEDLVQFSVLPGSKVSGVLSYNGIIKGGWFFEANIQINILDTNKNLLKADHATATAEWMTAEPIPFAGNIDLTGLPKGPAYFEIHNDNPSALPEHDKFIQIPIIIQ